MATGRQLWVDAAKGIGIVLVVLGHALDGVMSARMTPADGAWAYLHHVVYTFHMPLFFFLTGYFVLPRLERGRPRFGLDVLQRIVWPYLLWSLAYLAVSAAMSGSVNKPRALDLDSALALLWQPEAHLWFLYAVLLMHTASLIVPAAHRVRWLLAICIAGLVLQQSMTLPSIIDRVISFAPYYLAGAWAGAQVRQGALRPPPVSLPLLAAGCALGCWALASLLWSSQLHYWSKAATPAAVLGSIACIAWAASSRGRFGDVLLVLGRASMAIFVLHVLITAGTRIAFNRLAPGTDALVIVLVGTAAGVLLPLGIERVARRFGVSRLMGLG